MADVRLKSVVKRFGDVEIIHGVDLELKHREFVVFVGPSGCGKSTLLRLIAGLEETSDGQIFIDDKDVTNVEAVDRGIAMVFQSYALYPHMTVAENMGFGLRMSNHPKAEIDEKVGEAARILQLGPLMDRRPKALSGGQRQRVAIGRAIVRNPKVFLFDEPLSNLDAELRVQMRVEIAKLHQQLDATMIYVTHDQVEAMTMADKIVVLRGGYVEQVGAPLDLYHHPCNEFVAGFIGSPKMNFVSSEIVGKDDAAVTVALPGGSKADLPVAMNGAEIGQKVKLGIRPEHFSEQDDGNPRMAFNVEVAEHLGGTSFLYGQSGSGEQMVVEASGANRAKPGEALSLAVPPSYCHLFDSEGKAFKRLHWAE